MDRILDATDFMQDYSHPLTHSIVQQTDPMPFSVGYKKLNILFQYRISTTTPFIWMASDRWGWSHGLLAGCHSMEQGNYGNKKSSFYQFIFILMVRQSITHWLWIELTHTQDHIPYSTHVRLLLLGDHHFVCFPWRFLYQNRFIARIGPGNSQSMSPNACFLPTPYAYCRLKLTRSVSFIAAHTTFISLAFTFLFTPRRTEDCSTTSSSLLPQLRAD